MNVFLYCVMLFCYKVPFPAITAVLPDSKETKLGSSGQEDSPSAGKHTGVVLVPCLHMDISEVPGGSNSLVVKVPCLKPPGGSKVDSAFHSSKVDKMSTRNFWKLNGRK